VTVVTTGAARHDGDWNYGLELKASKRRCARNIMDLGLAGKQVLITGGSKGIGLAIAHAFAAEGAHLIIVSRNETVLEKAAGEVRRKHNAEVSAHPGDLSHGGVRERLHQAYSEVDILINNAGAIPGGGIAEVSMERWQEAWSLKVFGYIHLCQLYLAKMKARRSGTIINIIGMGGRAVRPDYICGAAGNAALIGFTNALGAETPSYDVRVFGINPAATMTDRIVALSKMRARTQFGDEGRWQELLNAEKLPFGRIKTAEEVAALAAMLASPQVHYLSGTVIDMDGGGQWRNR
jgi:NAD(P)-dependent dehydrogenase (short-subunit alcohol dehydrogenase family)